MNTKDHAFYTARGEMFEDDWIWGGNQLPENNQVIDVLQQSHCNIEIECTYRDGRLYRRNGDLITGWQFDLWRPSINLELIDLPGTEK